MCGVLHWASKPHGCLFNRTAEASVQAPAKLPRARGGEVGAVRLQAMEGPKQENTKELLRSLLFSCSGLSYLQNTGSSSA